MLQFGRISALGLGGDSRVPSEKSLKWTFAKRKFATGFGPKRTLSLPSKVFRFAPPFRPLNPTAIEVLLKSTHILVQQIGVLEAFTHLRDSFFVADLIKLLEQTYFKSRVGNLCTANRVRCFVFSA